MFTLIVLGGAAIQAAPASAARTPPPVGAPIGPDDPVPSDILFLLTEDMLRGIERLIDGLEAGEFDDAEPRHVDEAFDLLARATELQGRDDIVTTAELDAIFVPYQDLHVELTGTYPVPGALPELGPVADGPTAPRPGPRAVPPVITEPTITDEAPPEPTTAPTAETPSEPTAETPSEPVAETATAPPTPVDLPSGSPPPGSIRTDRLVSILLSALGLTALLAVAAYLFDRWRRRRLPEPSGRPGFHDLLDVSRRLAAAGTIDEAEILAVRQAMRLTGADAGAFVRRGSRTASVSYETSDDLLVPDRLNEGALDRVLAAGHELTQTTSVEPAIRQVPVSLLAMPVFNAGAVFGAIVLLRDAEQPFGAHERRMASDLKSIVGAAIEQAEHTEQVRAEALADGLTGVRNRRALDLDVAELADRRFSAVMVDLDHFKQVNDTYGHQAGDELLHAVAQRILANVRSIDEVYRYGGEEFAIVMPDTETATAGDIADRVRVALASAPFTIGPERTVHQATASLGVATGADGQSVFARADEALYAAKHGGRNRVVVATPAPMPPPAAGDLAVQSLR